MTIIVNLVVLAILTFIVFNIARAGLADLLDGLGGTLVFTSLIVLYLVVIFKMVLQNVAAGNDHDSILAFFAEHRQKSFRGRPDIVVKMVSWLGTVAWGILITLLVVLKEAAQTPKSLNPLDTDFNTLVNSLVWNPDWVVYAYILTPLMAATSALGLYLKSKRNKRVSDRYPLSLIGLFVLSCLGMVYLFI